MKLTRPKTPYRWLALAPLVLLLASCNEGLTGIDRTTSLRQAMQLWQQAGVRNYNYTLRRDCFCGREMRGPVRVEVRNGQTVSVTPTEGVTSINRAAFDAYDTVEELFGVVQTASAAKPFRLDARYDETLGYPIELYVDVRPTTADEEHGFLVSGFERL